MSEKIYLGRKVKRLQSSPEYGEYTKVRMITGDNTYVEAGNDTGLTLEVECPYATTEIAQSVLDSISGYHYRPYEAESARLEPDAEIGDGITTAGFYGGIYQMRRRFGRHSTSCISAPQNSEADHEVQYKSEADRKFTRKMKEVNAEFAIKMDKVYTQVTSGDNSFGWTLTEQGMKWQANGATVMELKDSGLKIWGTLESGSIITGELTVGGQPISAVTLRTGAQWPTAAYNSNYSNSGYALTFAGNYDNATAYQTNIYPAQFKCGNFAADYVFANSADFNSLRLYLNYSMKRITTTTINGVTVLTVAN